MSFKVTQKFLKEHFNYVDGKLILIKKFSESLRSELGKEFGYLDISNGYYKCFIYQKGYKLHRLIYLYHHGIMPSKIDHKDEIKTNNRIENLRPCTHSQNEFNCGMRSTNTSGVKGVYWDKNRKKWSAVIRAYGKRYWVGYFTDIMEAKSSVEKLREELHGEFCNHG